jgi:cell division septum initiation protein DivIVA
MTDKEFKRLNRAQLIEIIYRLQLQVDELTEQKQALESALEDRRLRIHNAGNIAEAALELNNCFLSAQNAADQYLNEIRVLHAEAEEERQRLLDNAHAEAEKIIENAKKEQNSQKFNYGTEFERLWVNLQMTGEEA